MRGAKVTATAIDWASVVKALDAAGYVIVRKSAASGAGIPTVKP